MPYIEKELREKLKPTINTLSEQINTVGSLNYAITEMCLRFLKRSVVSYASLNEIIGVLDCAKAEFYRRVVAVYENVKIELNGDVYADR